MLQKDREGESCVAVDGAVVTGVDPTAEGESVDVIAIAKNGKDKPVSYMLYIIPIET